MSENHAFNGRPGNLLVAPLWPVSSAVLQCLQHQQVALSVAQQQFGICTTGGVQQTLNSLKREEMGLQGMIRAQVIKKEEMTNIKKEAKGLGSGLCISTHFLQQAQCSYAVPGVACHHHSLQQAAQGLGLWVHGQSWRDGMQVLFQVRDALIVDVSHVIRGQRLLLLMHKRRTRI